MFLTAPIRADSILFNNFPINGNIGAFPVSDGNDVSDSFTLSTDGDVTEVMFGAWVAPGDSVTSVGWSIGTSSFDASDGFGFAPTSSTLLFENSDGFDVDLVSFAISSLPLSTGTYYLTLSDALSEDIGKVYWDINNAPGIDAWSTYEGGDVLTDRACFDAVGISGTCASSFDIVGSTSDVPEPSAWALFCVGILAATALRRSRIYR
jgi:hypothetical protein